jgi:hypothetical protein
MKKIKNRDHMKANLLLLFSFLLLTKAAAYAQCTGCTSTVSSQIPSGIVVNSGQTVCITPGGIVAGGIIVNSGGVLCNQGDVSGEVVIEAGGIFNNYGDTVRGGINVKGTFNNNAKTYVAGEFFVDSGGYLNNAANGTMLINGEFIVGNDSLNSSGVVNNYGCIDIIGGGLTIKGTNSVFYTSTMVRLNGEWKNYGTVTGPSSSCGGFNMGFSESINYGSFGVTGNLDMCNPLNPTSFTINTGTVGSGVTYCQCQNYCSATGISVLNQNTNRVSCFPNPTDISTTLSIYAEPGRYQIEIYNAVGQKVYTNSIDKANTGKLDITISTKELSKGIYVINIVGKNEVLRARFIKE